MVRETGGQAPKHLVFWVGRHARVGKYLVGPETNIVIEE